MVFIDVSTADCEDSDYRLFHQNLYQNLTKFDTVTIRNVNNKKNLIYEINPSSFYTLELC